MAEGGGREGFFWDTYPWVMSDHSSGGSGEAGSEERSSGNKNLLNLCIGKNHNQMKQPEMGDMGGSSGGDQEVAATTVNGGRKRNDDAFEIKNEMKTEDDTKVSLHNDKGKRELEPSDHELHIWTERERRKKMRNMFHQLHALIPQLPHKADKSLIVDEAVSYIKNLQQTLQKLEKKKLERLYGLSTNPTIASLVQPQRLVLDTRESFLADQGSSTSHIGKVSPPSSTSFSCFPLCSPTVFQTWASSNVILNVCGLDAHISICSFPKPGLLTAICYVLEKHKLEIVSAQISSDQSKSLFMIHAHANARDQFMETFAYDEIYKQAATEITHWVNSKSS